MKPYDCMIIGDVLFDVIVTSKSENIQTVADGISFSRYKGTFQGGCGNIALGISNLGGKTVLLGKAGNDCLGRAYSETLVKNNVQSEIIFDSKKPTGVVVSFVNKNERDFLVLKGASEWLTSDDVRKRSHLLEKTKFLYVPGYALASDPERTAALEAIEIAKKASARIVFDPAAHNLVKQNFQVFQRILMSSDVVSLNLLEAKSLTGCESSSDVIQALEKTSVLVALRLGSEGSIVFNKGQKIETAAFNVKVKDTTGAGDAFTSALIFGLSRNFTLDYTCKLANWYASEVVKYAGASRFPAKRQIRRFFLANH